jgi:hypothetical protein
VEAGEAGYFFQHRGVAPHSSRGGRCGHFLGFTLPFLCRCYALYAQPATLITDHNSDKAEKLQQKEKKLTSSPFQQEKEVFIHLAHGFAITSVVLSIFIELLVYSENFLTCHYSE